MFIGANFQFQLCLICHMTDELQLYLAAVDKRPSHWGPIIFHRFGAERGFGHLRLNQAHELPDLIDQFFENYKNKTF